MNDNVRKWLDALRSGEFTQTERKLRRPGSDGHEFCCLGVACELYRRETGEGEWIPVEEWYGFDSPHVDVSLPQKVQDWLGLSNSEGMYWREEERRFLTVDNDNGASFEDIADIIEREPKGLFHSPTEGGDDAGA